VRAAQDSAFARAIEHARLRVPDGMGIVYASRIAGRPVGGTVTGRLLLPAVADRAARENLRVALFGAGPGVAALAGQRLAHACPGLQIAAAISPPTPLHIASQADQQAVAALREAAPDVVFVSLGAPRQEIWMERHAAELNGAVLVGVGAALDIVAGRFREAPRWLTRVGLEWLFRLAQEPRRLARRYLLDDPRIFVWAVRARLGRTR
jgi:N-acetylglucosaminyldiphosphoundecaprenol N-acetyl-beta-D-mannosaminyltransferase